MPKINDTEIEQERREKQHWKNNYFILRIKYKAIEAQNKWLLWGVRGN